VVENFIMAAGTEGGKVLFLKVLKVNVLM